ncbi:hypothetical protein GQS52_26805 [Streptomyces sp. SCUT-3]|uniref:hypothetical protein n=1 Tax=Streptomyces sp. SCUT-3 TaxID=2684469 RepID=UPI000CAD60A1|nr:hypothetical protein [Streptomyces sp. SCUT-3]PLW69813.1 hypothetical protein C0036_20270 [Streptomyces sp. DJ]QMV20472.1 hypothetical protein GQS52_00055 [Streptomyces sp. SCUT-3]QMV24770.1 hypothetical protein GQS52_26805 [Streptomyces sp. SCUT-3]
MDWSDEEYCLYVNASEASSLWMILADYTRSEDEKEWTEHIPVFRRLISQWSSRGFLKLFQGEEWPADLKGREIPPPEVDSVLSDPDNWRYEEAPSRLTCITVGDREITELREPDA